MADGATAYTWRRRPGTYALALTLATPYTLAIGRLGTFAFRPGGYAYVGSALGPGGLGARLERHARREKRPHWHIDYLLAWARLHSVWHLESAERWECAWAEVLGGLPGVETAVPGFGASDCTCRSHLFYARDATGFAPFARAAEALCGASPQRTELSPG